MSDELFLPCALVFFKNPEGISPHIIEKWLDFQTVAALWIEPHNVIWFQERPDAMDFVSVWGGELRLLDWGGGLGMIEQLLYFASAALFPTFCTEDWRAGCRPAFEGNDILFGRLLKDGSRGWYERRRHSEHHDDPVFQIVKLLLKLQHDRQNHHTFEVPLDSLVITKSMVEQIVGHEISDDEWDGFTELREDEVAEFAAGVWQQLAADREEFALEQAELERHGGEAPV